MGGGGCCNPYQGLLAHTRGNISGADGVSLLFVVLTFLCTQGSFGFVGGWVLTGFLLC